MAANVLDSLTVRLEADLDPLRRGMKQAENAVREGAAGIQGALDRMDAKVAAAGKGLLAMVSIAAVQQLYSMGRAALSAAGDLGEMAESAGVSTQQLQVLIAAGVTAGAKVEDITTGMARFSRNLADASTKGGAAAAAFNKLGVATQTSAGGVRDTMEVLLDTATALAAIESPAQRVQSAMDVGGKSFNKLLPLLTQGKDGLLAFAAQAEKMGYTLKKGVVETADAAADKLALLDLASANLDRRIATALMPTITEWIIKMKELGASFLPATNAIDRLDAEITKMRSRWGGNLMAGFMQRQVQSTVADLEEQKRRLHSLNRPVDAAPAGDPGRLTRGEDDPVAKMIRQLDDQLTIARMGDSIAAKQMQATNAAREAARSSNLPLSGGEKSTIEELVRRREATEDLRKARELLAQVDAAADDAQAAGMARSTQIMQERDQARLRMNFDLGEEVKQNDALIAALGKSNEAYQQEVTLQEIREKFRRAGIPLLAEEEAQYARIAARLGEQKQKMDDLKSLNDSIRDAGRDAFHTIGTALEDAIVQGKSFRDVLAGVAQDLIRIATRVLVTKPLETALSGAVQNAGGLSGLLGGLFSSGAGGSVGATGAMPPVQGFAAGGNPPVGMPSIVGENGPEIFVPRVAGTIIPNGGGGGGTFYIDARGADQAGLARLEGMIRSLDGSIETRAVTATIGARGRGGSMARAMGARS